MTFEEAWAKKEAEGYRYGEDALAQVRLGWEMRAGEIDRIRAELTTANGALSNKVYVLQNYAALLEQNIALGKDRDRIAAELTEANKTLEGATKVLLAERHVWAACREAALADIADVRDAWVAHGPARSDNVACALDDVRGRISLLEPPATGLKPVNDFDKAVGEVRDAFKAIREGKVERHAESAKEAAVNLTLDSDGLFVVEAWKGRRKLTLYVGAYDWVKVSGLDDITDGTMRDVAPKELFDWLNGVLDLRQLKEP